MAHLDAGTVERLLAGALEPNAAGAVREHLAGCGDCQRRVGELVGSRLVLPDPLEASLDRTDVRTPGSDSGPHPLPASASGPHRVVAGQVVDLEKAARMGRYVVLQRLGAGGMGVVYAAYDPELDRRVALKLLRSDSSLPATQGQARLLREAQAMARLTHPNVIAVHDVGTLGDEVFVAMDLVDGRTVGEWLQESARPWREVLAVFAAAGRGLAAAHAAGLVHRDFKPDNVLVGKDGSVRVTDFGLATQAAAPGATPPSAVPGPIAATVPFAPDRKDTEPGGFPSGPLTVAGTVMGTPEYMSPEQHLAAPTDARSDQFSFCAALYEALYRQRPFPGDSRELLAIETAQGRFRPPPEGSPVPDWVWPVVRRGLSPKSEDRWPDMERLLAALADDPSVKRRRLAVAAVALLALGAGVFGVWRTGQARTQLCRGAEQKLAGVGDAARRQALQAAILHSGVADAASVSSYLDGALGHWADEFVSAHRDACEATRIRGEQTEEVLGLRMACLEDRLADARALGDALASADAATAAKAPDAVRALGSPSSCGDLKALRAQGKAPTPEQAAGLEPLRDEIARAKALKDLGRYDESSRALSSLLEKAKRLGYGPTIARLTFQLGLVSSLRHDAKGAAGLQLDALVQAVASGEDEMAVRASQQLALPTRDPLARERSRAWLRLSQALLARSGGPPDLGPMLLGTEATYALYAQDYPTAVRELEAAAAAMRKIEGDQAALETAVFQVNIANAHFNAGKFADALPRFQEALAIRERIRGPGHPELVSSLSGIAESLMGLGRHAEAAPPLERAIAISERRGKTDNPELANLVRDRALAAIAAGAAPDAVRFAGRAVALSEKAGGDALGGALFVLGEAQARAGRHAEALESHRRALPIMEKAVGPDEWDVGAPLTGIGEALVALHRPAEALPFLERALRIRTAVSGDAAELADTRRALATALWDARGDRARAIRLATEAREAYAKAPGRDADARDAAAWLASHR